MARLSPLSTSNQEASYAPGTLVVYVRVAERFCAQVRRRDLDEAQLSTDVVESVRTAVLNGIPERSCRGAIYPLKRFIEYLVDTGIAAVEAPAVASTAMERLGEEYEHYLRHERGLSDATIYHCMRFFVRFMAFRFGEDLGDLEAITPDDIVDYLLSFRQGPVASRDKTPPSHLRNLFKFLFWSGKTKRNLADSVPRVAQPKSTSLPRHLSPEEVQQLIDSVRSDDAVGRRNYAMLLLVARLGLRAPELVAIQLEDIDWRAGEILIRGKGRLHDRMPLPVDVGEALVDYIRNGRAGASRSLFVCCRAPFRPFVDAQIVNALLRQAFNRTGLRPPQAYVGSHVLRHSLATDMLQKGASLDEIGDVLRHRSRMATTIYAQYDVEALRSIARPWPEPVSPAPLEQEGV